MVAARLVALAALLAACGGGDDAAVLPDAGVEPDAEVVLDPTDQLFDPTRIIDVEITMAAADWAQLRVEPDQLGMPEVTCANQPTEEPYTKFPADITVDGVTVTDVGIRKKGGFGSVSDTKPGFKVKANEYVSGNRIFGLKHLTLNNNVQDESLISQCLGYQLFASAGLAASRCNFARVTVNGEDLGIYSNVETIKGNFLRRNFGDDTGRLYESGGDWLPGGTGGFQPKDEPIDCSDLDPVVTALDATDDALAASLDAVIDLDEFLRYWAMEVLTDHWDGYANNRNNHYFYHSPVDDRLHWIPWGIDDLFSGRQRTTRPYAVFACGSLTWRLYDAPETRAMYLAALRDVIADVWDEAAILDEIDRLEDLLGADAPAEIDDVRAFVSGRAAQLLAELDAGEPVWPYPAGEQSCRISLGTISATFDTTWDTLDTFGVGSGTMSGTIAGVDTASDTVYASAGLGDDGKPIIQLFSPLPDGRYTVIFVIVQDPANFTPGTRAIDLANVASILTFYDPVTDTASGGGLLLPGSLTLTAASTTADAPVTGSLTGDVIEL